MFILVAPDGLMLLRLDGLRSVSWEGELLKAQMQAVHTFLGNCT